MKYKNKVYFAIGWLAFLLLGMGMPRAFAVTPQDRALFQKANQLYYSEKFEAAGEIYSQLAERNPQTAVFQFNLGNTYFRLKKTGPAILAYEKARSLDPRNQDVRKNLEHVRAGLEYRIEDKRNWYLIAGEKVLEQFTEEEISLFAAGVYFAFMVSLCLPLWRLGILRFDRAQKILLSLLVFSLVIFAAKRVEVRVIRDAIVMAKKADARFGPSDGDRVAFHLGEGLKVFVIDRRDDWSRIILTSGEDGWIKNSQIAEVV